jgi:hypothetical protein
MANWPLLQRNKVDDSKVTVPVKICAESENEAVRTLAQKVTILSSAPSPYADRHPVARPLGYLVISLSNTQANDLGKTDFLNIQLKSQFRIYRTVTRRPQHQLLRLLTRMSTRTLSFRSGHDMKPTPSSESSRWDFVMPTSNSG